MTFKDLGLDDIALQGVAKAGFEEPTDIQAQTIPMILAGEDVIATSSTGSGKTLAFGLGVLQQLKDGHGVQMLVLAPTRELAEQISMVLDEYGKPRRLVTTAIYGGVAYGPQEKELKNADIVVATPGRLLDHIERRNINLTHVTHVVLDEADRMLDMGFLPDVERILSECPQGRQTLLYTATLPTQIVDLAHRFMNDPKQSRAGVYVDPKQLKQVYYNLPGPLKFSLLVHLLKQEKEGLVMVFCNSRRFVDLVSKGLTQQGIDAMAIHGGLTQQMRRKVLGRFNDGHAFVLVCTDVASRGLDIPGVTHVYNFDLPDDPKQYIHRIGRTARAGEDGMVVNLLGQRDHDNFSRIVAEEHVEVEQLEKPYVKQVDLPRSGDRRSGPRGSGGRGGPRKGGRRGGPGGSPSPREKVRGGEPPAWNRK